MSLRSVLSVMESV